jgi:hypothetical protein
LRSLSLPTAERSIWLNWVLSIVVSLVFFAYCLSGEGRDERGRAIIGTACMYGASALIILMNIPGYFCNTAMTNPAIFSNCLHLVYNLYFIAVLTAIATLHRPR